MGEEAYDELELHSVEGDKKRVLVRPRMVEVEDAVDVATRT